MKVFSSRRKTKNIKSEKIKTFIKANAHKDEIAGLYQGRIKIKVKQIPQKGKANKGLIEFLAERLNIPKKSIEIVSGLSSSFKTLEIQNPYKRSIENILLDDEDRDG